MSTMISDGDELGVAADEWLSVVARDGRGRVDPRMMVSRGVLSLRIRGRDLAALHEGSLSDEEVRQRVESLDAHVR